MSVEWHFSPLVVGVKHLSNPLILRFSFEKSLKSTDFCLFWFLFWVGKDNLHYSDRLRFLLRFFSGLKFLIVRSVRLKLPNTPWAKSFWAFSPSYTTCESSVFFTKQIELPLKNSILKSRFFPMFHHLFPIFT
jgi:hypothetical protein